MSADVFGVNLPSQGVLYDGKLPGGKVCLRPMGEAEEALLFQPGGDPMMKMQRIIDNCYVDKEKFPPKELLMVDRFYLLFLLRVQMFGSTYQIPFRCQACRHQRKINVNIMEDLDKKTMSNDLVEPFDVTLPHSGKGVQFRLLRGKDEDEVAKHSKRMLMKSADVSDDSYRVRIGKQIVAIDGIEPASQKDALEFARSLDMCDANEFRLAVEAVEGGIDLTLFEDCPACGYTNEFVMPFTVEFLRPSQRFAGGRAGAEILPA